MKQQLRDEVFKKALELYGKAHIVLTDEEKRNLEIADFGLNDIYTIGLEIVTYINTDRVCAKEMVLLPFQTCPEHVHAPFYGHNFGKEETFRCRYGVVYLYTEGEPVARPRVRPPERSKPYFTVFHEIELHAGKQYTIFPNTKHWFQAGKDGAVISEFSTTSCDKSDIFTDPNVKRIPTEEE